MSDLRSTRQSPLDARFNNLKVFSYKQWDTENPDKKHSAFIVEGDSFFDGRVNIGGRLSVAELDIIGEDGGGINVPGGSDGDVLISDISSSMQWRKSYWKTNDSPVNKNGPTDNIIYSTHKIGLGVTNVTENLSVSGNVKINDIYIGDSADDSTSIISQYSLKTNPSLYAIKIDTNTELSLNTSSNIKFNINDSEIARFNNSGNLGIGITNPQANLHVAGNTIVDGNLTVNGNLTTVNSETLEIEDSMIFLAKDNNSDNIDLGIVGQYVENGTTKFTGIFRDADGDTGYFNFYHNLEEKPTTTVNINHSSFERGNLHVGGLKVDHGVTFTSPDAFIYSDDLTFSAIDPSGSGYVGFNVTSSPTDAVDVQQGIVIRDGNLKIGITDSQASVHINRSDVIVIPAGDTSERLDITAAIRYNSDTISFEGYNGTNWGALGGVKDVDGDTYVSAEDSSGVDNDELKFYTAGNESMIIDSNGVVGINTIPTGVTYKLEMEGIIGITGSILPMVDRVFNLGSTSQRWGDLYFGGETIYLGDSVLKDYSGTLTITGPTQIDELSITQSVDIDGNLDVSGLADINNLNITENLSVSGKADIYDLYITNDANIKGELSIYDLNVSNSAIISADLTVTGNTNIVGAITASSINLSGSGDVNGDLSLSGDVNIGGDAKMNTISVTGDADIDGNLDVSGTLIMNNLFVTYDATIGNNLLVTGNSDLQGNLDVSGLAQISFLNVSNDVDIDGNLDVSGTLTMNNLNVTNDANIGNDLFVTGNSILQGTLDVTGNSNLKGTLIISGKTTINNNLDVIGNAGIGSLNITNDAKISGNFVVDGNMTVHGTTTTINTETLAVEDPIIKLGSNNNTSDIVDLGYYGKYVNTGVTNYSGVVRDASDGVFKFYNTETEPTTIVDFNDPTLEYADVKMDDLDANKIDANNVNISNDLDVAQSANVFNLNVSNVAKFSGDLSSLNLYVSNNAYINNDLYVTNNTTIQGTLFVTDDTTLKSDLLVGDNTLYVNHDINTVGINTTSTEISLYVSGTDGIVIPVGDNNERVDITGAIRYNTDTQSFEGYSGTWGSLGGVRDVDQDTYISAEDSASSDNDQLKFFTAGTEKMRIDTNGYIGIGVTNPTHLLDITGTHDNNTFSSLSLRNGNNVSTFADEGQIRFGWNGSTDYAHFIHTRHNSGGVNNAIDFYVNDGTQNNTISTGSIYSMSINDGNLGIGITNPTNKLDVDGNASIYDFLGVGVQNVNYPLHVESVNNNSWSTKLQNDNASLYALHTNGNAFNINSGINSSTNYLMKLKNNSFSEIFNVLNNGNVGINTGTPSKKLEINTSDLEDGAIIGSAFIGNDVSVTGTMILTNNILKSNANDYAIKQNINGQTDINSKTGEDLFFNINNSPYLTIKSDGKIGIHTTTPSEQIEIKDNVLIDTTSGVSLTVTNTLSDIYMARPDGSGIFVQSGTTLNYALKLQENNNDLFTVYNNGNISIGSTQGDNKFTIESGLSIMEGGEQLNINVTNNENIIQSDNHLLINISSNDILDIKQDNVIVNGNLNVTGSQYIANQLLIGTTTSNYQLEVSGDTRLNGDVIISGILSFEGVSVDSFEFQDSLIKLGNNNTDNTEDIGFYGKYIETGVTKYTGLFNDASDDNTFILFKDLETDPTTTVDITDSSFTYADLTLNNLDALGQIGIGITNPQVQLHVSGTDGIVIPVGNTTQRVDVTGAIRYNSETQQFEGYSGTWGSLGGVIDIDQDTYISAENAPGDDNDQLKFFTASSQRMVIDSNGYIGVGITNPSTSLHISSSNTLVIPVGDTLQRINVTGGIRYNKDLISFEGFDGSNWGSLGGVKDVDQDTYISAEDSPGSDNDQLKFFTANIQHMVIDSSGKVGIGITNPQYALDVDGIIQSNDEMLAPEFTATCDIRVKENIKRLDDKFLEKLCNLNLFEYNYTSDYSKNNEKMYGLIAQNVEKVIPEAIKTKSVKIQDKNIDDFKTISQNTLITYLIGSMQQLTKHHNNLATQFMKLQTDYIELKKDYDLQRELNEYKKN